MADTAAATGTRTQSVEFEGQTWTLVPADYGVQGEYESWLESERMQTAYRLGLYAPPAAYAVLIDTSIEAIHAKKYEWGGALANAILNTDHGRRKLIELCLKRHHPRVDAATVRRLFEAKRRELNAALVVLNPSLFPRAPETQDGGGDPKGEAGTGGAAPPGPDSSGSSPSGA